MTHQSLEFEFLTVFSYFNCTIFIHIYVPYINLNLKDGCSLFFFLTNLSNLLHFKNKIDRYEKKKKGNECKKEKE